MIFGPLTPGGTGANPGVTCGETEGFDGNALETAQRIQSLGGNLQYIDMDEPLYYGHFYSGIKNSGTPSACQPSAKEKAVGCQASVQNVVSSALASLQAIQSVFPQVQIGEDEPLDGIVTPGATPLSAYQEWLADMKSAGYPITFFHDDAKFSVPMNLNIPTAQSYFSSQGIPFGMIFNGHDDATSDSAWMTAAEIHIQSFNQSGNSPLQQLAFETWSYYPQTPPTCGATGMPTNVLPETSTTALTYLIDFYYSPQASVAPMPDGNESVILLPGNGSAFRATCSLNSLGTAAPDATNQVNYAYCLMLARAPTTSELSTHSGEMSSGSLTVQGLLDLLLASKDFQTDYFVSTMSNTGFVTFLYDLLLFEAPPATSLSTAVSGLNSGALTQQQVFDSIVQSASFGTANSILQ